MNGEFSIPERLHLHRLSVLIDDQHPLYFITICSHNRERILAHEHVAGIIIGELVNSERLHGWQVGRYVVMPDHVHFFCSPAEGAKSLSAYMSAFKNWTTKQIKKYGYSSPIWQKEFFDHVLRSTESYAEKWEYVRLNPMRAGLCKSAEQWPFQGEISNFPIHR